MKSYLLYGLIATVLFAASATVSLYYMPTKPTTAEPPKTTAAKTTDTGAKSSETEPPPEKMKPLVRPGPADTEQAAQLLQTLRDREKAVREKEDQFAQRRKQMELIYQDIRGERTMLDELRKQVADELREVGKKVTEMDKKSTDLDKQRQNVSRDVTDLQKRQIDLESTERKNIEQLAKVYESMAPERAALIIQQLADSGHLETAVKLLSLMKDRKAAGILDQITDAVLAAQLTEKLRGIKRASITGVSTSTAPPIH